MKFKQQYLLLVAAFLVVGGICFYIIIRPSFVSRLIPKIPEHTKLWPSYSSTINNFNIKFPPFLMAETKDNLVKFFHSTLYTHPNYCDFIDIGVPLTSLVDVDITLSVHDLSLKDTIDNVMGREGSWRDFLDENGEFIDTQFMSERFSAGRYDGHKLSLSVEWCGRDFYFFEINNKFVVIQKPIRGDLLKDSKQYAELVKSVKPAPLSLEASEELVRDMMSTFEFKKI